MLNHALHLMTVQKAVVIHAAHLPTLIFSLALFTGHKASQQTAVQTALWAPKRASTRLIMLYTRETTATCARR